MQNLSAKLLFLVLIITLWVNPGNCYGGVLTDGNIPANFNPYDIDYSEMNAPAMLGANVVANYAGSTHFFSVGNLWSTVTEASGAPDSVATFTQLFPNDTSRYLYARNFNFNIPCNATITNLTVRITRQNSTNTDVADALVAVFNPNTLSAGGINMADPSVWVEGGNWETISYSHANWGEVLTPELVNSNRFGVLIQAQHLLTAGLARAWVDAIEMEVCYNVGTPYADPITFTTNKVDACFNEGIIDIQASGGSGSYEYSIDNGMTWQTSGLFTNLALGDYTIVVRNDDGTCQTERFYCNLSGDDRIVQPGDAIVACATFPGNRVTLAIEKVQPFHELYSIGETGYDISFLIPFHPYEWTIDQLQGEIFSFDIDSTRNIYTATTMLYNLVPGFSIIPYVSKIDAFTGNVTLLSTLPGDAGATGVEYDTICDQLYVGNLSDGRIYRLDPESGVILSTYDPGSPDNGASGMAPLGERILGMGWNHVDERLYYAVWASDFNMTGIRNTIRSVAIDPATCDFLPGTDQLEITLPWISEYGDPGNPDNYSMPVGDIEFSTDGMTMLLGETGFDSDVPRSQPHEARVLRYLGSSGSWTLQTTVPPGNFALQHELGEVSAGLNARGGVDFANSGFNSFECSIDQDSFIVATADALRGADCNTLGCLYGLQYLPMTGGNSQGSVLLDVARDIGSQQKSVFGDVDLVQGCLETYYCCPDVDSPAPDEVICTGGTPTNVNVSSQADSMVMVYFTSVPADSLEIYTTGTPFDTTALAGGSGTLDFNNFPTSTPGTYYVYTLVHPTPVEDYCRPYDSLIINITSGSPAAISDPADRCIDGADMSFTGTPAPGGGATGVFSTNATAGLTDNGDGTADLEIDVAGAGTFNVIYEYTDATGCITRDTASITILDVPAVGLNDPSDECEDGSLFSFTGSPLPGPSESGIFSTTAGGGLTDNGDGTASLDPSVAGPGTYDVTYTFTDINGCTNNTTVSVTVNGSPTASLNDAPDACVAGTSVSYTGSPLPGTGGTGVFSTTAPGGLTDNGDGTADLDPGVAGVGIFDVSYLYTDSIGCTDIATVSIEVFDTLAPVVLNSGSICSDSSFGVNSIDLNTLIVSGPGGGSWSDTDGSGGLSGSVFTADASMEGNSYTFSYTITGPGPAGSACQTRTFATTVDVNSCNLDLALIMTTGQATPVFNGELVSYNITVCNQGATTVDSIEVMVYPGSCYGFTNNNNWSSAGADIIRTLTVTNGELSPGGLPGLASAPANCITLDVDLTVTCGNPADLISYAEITGARDTDGNTGDTDSTPGSDSPAERSVTPGSADDDSFSDINEDDHDPATMPVVDIAMVKTLVSVGPFSYGDALVYNIEVINQGNVDLANIELTDYIPCGMSYNPGNTPVWTDLGATAVTTIADLDAGQTTNVAFTLDLNPYPGGCALDSAWINEAEISSLFDDALTDVSSFEFDSNIDNIQGNDAGGAAGSGSDDAITGDGTGIPGDTSAGTDEDDHDPAAYSVYDLSLSKAETSSGPYTQGSPVSYSITVTNEGNIDAYNVGFAEIPQFALTYVGSDAGGDPNITEVSPGNWIISNLPAGTSATVNVDFTVTSTFGGLNITNNAMITSDDGDDADSDPDQDNSVDEDGDGNGDDDDEDAVTIAVEPAYDLSLVKTEISSGPYYQGSVVSYEVIVSNDGPIDAANITISDTPGAGLSYLSDDSGSNPNVNHLGGMNYEILDLDAGTTESVVIQFTIDDDFQGTSIGNDAQITTDDGDDVDSDPGTGPNVDEDGDGNGYDDDEDFSSISVTQIYDLSLEKTIIGGSNITPGSIVTYEITVTNEGTLDANGVQVTDIPAGDLIYSSDNSGSDPNITAVSQTIYTINSIPRGGFASFRINYMLNPGVTSPTVENIAIITQDDGLDIDSDPDQDHTVDDDGDGNPYDDDEDSSTFTVVYGFSIGDFVWHDLNGDGIQNFEPGIPDVMVELYTVSGFLLARTFTDAAGYYEFESINPGRFYIQIHAGEAWNATSFNRGNNDNSDSDITGENGENTTSIFEITSDDYSIDGGFVRCAEVGGLVWYDYNENDQWDSFENGINQLKVEIYRQVNGEWLLWDVTYTSHKPGTPSDDGYYKFCVPPGTYHIKFVNPPTTLVAVVPNVGFDDNVDSDVTGAFGSGTTGQFTVLSGDENCTFGAGYYVMGTMGDYVWYDNNFNGMRDAGEAGVEGVLVMAVDVEGDLVSYATTDAEGRYMIDYLGKDAYYLQFNLPSGYSITSPNMGGDDAMDSDVDHSNGPFTTKFYAVAPGEHVPNIDAGLISGPLPVVWRSLSGEHREDHNYLHWMVSQEMNVSHYEIERSLDGIDAFRYLGEAEAHGSVQEDYFYDFKDAEIDEPGIYYYRIKQVDLDGRYSYSEIISILVESNNNSKAKIAVYPNPVYNEFTIEIKVAETIGTLSVDLYDEIGRLIREDLIASGVITPGAHELKANISDLDQGIYTLKIEMDGETLHRKIIFLGR